MTEAKTITLSGVQSPYLEHYLGLWAMKEDFFRAAVDRIGQLDLRLHIEQEEKADEPSRAAGAKETQKSAPSMVPYDLSDDGVATVEIRGSLMKARSSLSASTSTAMLRRTMRAMAADDSVKRVMLVFDSPGGSVPGTSALGDDVAALAEKKPVMAFVEDLAASAAYWIASQATEISADTGSWVGSMGVYGVVNDYSAAAARDGVKVHVIRSAPFKGSGEPGTEITAPQLADRQRQVDAIHAQFVNTVANGRGLSPQKVSELADGRVHIAAEAQKLGLVDHVENLDGAYQRLRAMTPSGPAQAPTLPRRRAAALATHNLQLATDTGGCSAGENDTAQTPAPPAGSEAENKESHMTTQTQAGAAAPAAAAPQSAPESKPASIKELRAAFPNDAAFALESAEKAFTLVEAKAAYADVLQTRLSEANQKLAQAATKPAEQPAAAAPAAPAAPTKKPGVPALDNGAVEAPRNGDAAAGGDAQQQFKAKVQEQIKAGKTRDTAVALVAQENPELHQAMIEQATADHNKRRAMLRQLGQR